jgi:hypothetical protein
MSRFGDREGDIALQTRQADVEAGSQQQLSFEVDRHWFL